MINKQDLTFIPIGKSKDLTGMHFGKLVVLGRAPKPKNSQETRAFWWCECDCPERSIIKVMGKSLLNGNTKSCGCLQKEKAKENAILKNTTTKPGKGNAENLIGKHFGYLTALEPTDQRAEDGSIIWRCQCQRDNNIIFVSSHLLKNGSVQSCGCLLSKGEAKIQNLLDENGIKYITQYSFPNLKSENKYPLKFDFAVLDSSEQIKYLIEYDGIQHYQYTGSGWNTKGHFLYTKEHDKLKNEYCQQHNIPLIRIPYSKFDTLTIKDLVI